MACGNIPQNPKTLPCLHVFCASCFEKMIKSEAGEAGDETKPRCIEDACHQPFTLLPEPESGCRPLRTSELTADHFLEPARLGTVKDCNYKVRRCIATFGYRHKVSSVCVSLCRLFVPADVVSADSLNSFKTRLKTHLFALLNIEYQSLCL